MINKYLLIPLFILIIFLGIPRHSFAATLSITPTSKSYVVGSTFPVKILVSSIDTSINAVSGIISFSPSVFSVVSISKSNSILNFWPVEPSSSLSSGTVHFEGVDISGFKGSNGTVVTVVLRAKRAGVGKITFQRGQVLANDGKGNDVTSGLYGATFTIRKNTSLVSSNSTGAQNIKSKLFANITSLTHPVQIKTKWYNSSHVILDWINSNKTIAVRLGYDKKSDGKPTVFYNNSISHKEIELEDGVWYFHVQEKGSDNGWGPVSTFRIQIDSVPPLPITINFPNSATNTGSNIPVYFATTDALSGIDHYQVTVGGSSFTVNAQEGGSLYTLPVQGVGRHALIVKAYDKAGNSVSAKKVFTILGGTNKIQKSFLAFGWKTVNYLSVVIIVLVVISIIMFGIWSVWHHFRRFRKKYSGTFMYEHKVLREQFNELTVEIINEVMRLENVGPKRKLTRKEILAIGNLKKLIQKTEFLIENHVSKSK